MLENIILNALKQACENNGGQVPLSKKSGVSQGQISDYICGRRKISNMTIGTLEKLFPDVEIKCFNDVNPKLDVVENEIMQIVQSLSPAKKAQCLKFLAANFSEEILKETKQ